MISRAANAQVAASLPAPTRASRVAPNPAVPLQARLSLLPVASLPPSPPSIGPKIPLPALKSRLPHLSFRPCLLLALVVAAPPIILFPQPRCILLFPRRREPVALEGKGILPRVLLLGFAPLIIHPTGILSLTRLVTDITKESRMDPSVPASDSIPSVC